MPPLPAELGDYHVTDLASQHGTWVNDKRLAPNVPFRLHPGDTVRFGAAELGGKDFKVRMVHRSLLENGGRHGSYERRKAAAQVEGDHQVALK